MLLCLPLVSVVSWAIGLRDIMTGTVVMPVVTAAKIRFLDLFSESRLAVSLLP